MGTQINPKVFTRAYKNHCAKFELVDVNIKLLYKETHTFTLIYATFKCVDGSENHTFGKKGATFELYERGKIVSYSEDMNTHTTLIKPL